MTTTRYQFTTTQATLMVTAAFVLSFLVGVFVIAVATGVL